MRIVAVETTRHSALLKRILNEYRSGVEIHIDDRCYGDGDIAALMSTWCTNREIRGTRDFRLLRAGRLLFSFHDGPENLFAAHSELAFVRALRDEKIIRYRVLRFNPNPPPLLTWLARRFIARIRGLLRP